jgi:cobaltochelatase CobS
MRDSLLTQSKPEILWIFRTLNGGTVGFNFETVQKVDLIDRLLLAFTEDQIQSAISNGFPQVNPKGVEISEEGTPVPPIKPSAPKASDSDALDALRKLLSPTVDEATVRQIVMAEVKKAMDDSPVVKIEVVRPDGSAHKVEGHVRPEFKKILTRASIGINTLLVGPAGCGKTHLAHQVAEALGRPFASVSCTAGMSESALQGWLIPGENNGAFEYLSSDFVRMYEQGGVFLFDEIDGSDSNTLLFMNQALANGSFFLPIRKGASLVKRHPDFVCMAAANTFGTGANQTYAGRERLDESTLDRFRAGVVSLDYDQTFERKSVAPDLLAWGWAIRKRISEARLRRVMSTRFLLDATKLLKAGETVEEIKATFFEGWASDEIKKVEV